jgi:eukaryotic-like serine/threonine-protein kinase
VPDHHAPPGGDPVAALVARGEYVQAAAEAAAQGDLRRAIQLYERIWRFADAVPLAERLGDRPLAVRLALDARDRAKAAAIAAAIPVEAREDLLLAAEVFARRGHLTEAAAARERAGAFEQAAALHLRAGALLQAARLFERAGKWQEAGRLYEEVAAAVERGGAAGAAAEAQLSLGRLLGRLGRPREAVRALQAAARHPATTTAAWQRLCLELDVLGLPHAAQEIATRLRRCHPELPDRASAIAALELQVADGRESSPQPLERFCDLRLLGAGALGRVYAAEDRLTGETVALKILEVGPGGPSPERQSFVRFLREAEASSRLRHPHIVRLLEVDERAGMLVFEHVPGGTLAATLARQGRLTPAAARRLGLEILSALGAAHRSGIVHRDVKPSNIFFDAAGNAKLADFGAAHLADFGATQTAGFIGTLGYLSPEQISGAPIGFAADLYGLGVTLFEALTGRLPFLGPDIVAQHLAEPPPRPGVIEPTLLAAHDEVLLRALAKAPDDRYPSAEAMAEAVRAWPEHGGPPAVSRPGAATARIAPEAAVEPPPPVREVLGRTERGRLVSTENPRVGRRVLIEELDQELDEGGRERLRGLARAGGPHVQRILAVDADGRAVVYEALDGEEVSTAALTPKEARALAPAWAALADAGFGPSPDLRVVRTAGGPVILVVTAVIPSPLPRAGEADAEGVG